MYNADGSVRGELTYFVSARFGRAHCALCDITHGLVRERAEWSTFRSSLPVPFDTYHRDDQPDNVRAAHLNATPVVLAATDDELVMLMSPEQLTTFGGSVERLAAGLRSAATNAGLAWPP